MQLHSTRTGIFRMDVAFSDEPPVDPMDGDYLWFAATVDGQAVKCCVTFDAISPRSNNIESVKVAFWRKKDDLYATARAKIEAGEIQNGEILIVSLDSHGRSD